MKRVTGRRAISIEPLATQWQPVDLACRDEDGNEISVRTKLIRDERTAAVCISEAVSHRFLTEAGLPVADACYVSVSASFAAELTRQFGFSSGVRPGGHWGTEYLGGDAFEIQLESGIPEQAKHPEVAFGIYLADAVLANRDRLTYGNVLLLAGSAELLAIDQSDCFGGPDCMLKPASLLAIRDDSLAQPAPDMEAVILTAGRAFVESKYGEFERLENVVGECVEAAPEEWYDCAGIDPETIEAFLAHRAANIRVLGRAELYVGCFDAIGGGHVLDF